jgi:hypothetical protein
MDINLPENLTRLVNGELDKGERIRWLGQPVPKSGLPKLALLPFFFAIPWTLFALFWIVMASGLLDQGGFQLEPARLVFALFGVPFVLVGLAMMSSPWWMKRRVLKAAQQTVYVITDRRAIIVDGGYYGDTGLTAGLSGFARSLGRGTSIRSYTPDQLGRIERFQRDDGSGDVIFGEVVVTGQINAVPQLSRTGFLSVPDAKHVEETLKSLTESPRAGA